jgi:hypothetical protein
MDAVREAYKLMRWRFLPVRYAGKLRRLATNPGLSAPIRGREAQTIAEQGYTAGPGVPADLLDQMRAIYLPRGVEVVPKTGGHPFTNLMRVEDFTSDNPVLRFAMSRPVLDIAHDYFGGRLVCDSLQVLYSWPTGDMLSESQMWHKDYGDSRSLHVVAYVNDVLDDAGGPFGFVDRQDTKRISASPFIRRINDARFARELGDGTVRVFRGRAGESVAIDPSSCYHYGSRCERPRTAVFVTFSTDRPFVAPVSLVTENAERLRKAATELRPDLSDAYLARLFSAA